MHTMCTLTVCHVYLSNVTRIIIEMMGCVCSSAELVIDRLLHISDLSEWYFLETHRHVKVHVLLLLSPSKWSLSTSRLSARIEKIAALSFIPCSWRIKVVCRFLLYFIVLNTLFLPWDCNYFYLRLGVKLIIIYASLKEYYEICSSSHLNKLLS